MLCCSKPCRVPLPSGRCGQPGQTLPAPLLNCTVAQLLLLQQLTSQQDHSHGSAPRLTCVHWHLLTPLCPAAPPRPAPPTGQGQKPRPSRVSTLAMFQESRRNTEESAQLAGSPSFEFAGSPCGGSPVPMLGAGSPSTQAASALSPAATPRTAGTTAVPAKPQLHSAVSDAAALAAAARLARLPTHAGDALAGAMAGDALTEAQKQLLAAVDVDYLHSFRCGWLRSCCFVLHAACCCCCPLICLQSCRPFAGRHTSVCHALPLAAGSWRHSRPPSCCCCSAALPLLTGAETIRATLAASYCTCSPAASMRCPCPHSCCPPTLCQCSWSWTWRTLGELELALRPSVGGSEPAARVLLGCLVLELPASLRRAGGWCCKWALSWGEVGRRAATPHAAQPVCQGQQPKTTTPHICPPPLCCRSCADAMLHATAGAEEPVGFTDIATLWRFVDAVRRSCCMCFVAVNIVVGLVLNGRPAVLLC